MLTVLVVALGAAVGAPSRYLLDRAVQNRLPGRRRRFPFGTLTINLSGSAILGLLVGLSARGLSPTLFAALGTGWCGAFTTYSTFGYEAVMLGRDRLPGRAIGYVVLSVLGGLALAALGVTIGRNVG